MSFLKYLSTLVVPSKMGKRKNINIFVSIAILLIVSYLISLPYIVKFEENSYDVFKDSNMYSFNIFDHETSREVPFLTDEINEFSSRYTLITERELKNIDFKVKKGKYVLPDSANDLNEVEYNYKNETDKKVEYLLKREVFYFDSVGTKLDQTDIYYIHIVFDLFDKLEEDRYEVKKKFDTLYTEDEFNHYLLVFYYDGVLFRNKQTIDSNMKTYQNLFEYGSVSIDFSNIDNLDYLTHKITKVIEPYMKTQYTYNGFIYAVLAPILISLLAHIFVKNKRILFKYKHYFNVASVCSIPVSILFFIIEWFDFFIRIGIMEFYWVFFSIFYVITISLINKNEVIE